MPFPEVCLDDKQHRPNEWPTFKFSLNTEGEQEVTLHQGEQNCVFVPAEDKLTFSARYYHDKEPFIEKEMTVTNCEEGIVKLALTQEEVECQGLFLAQITWTKRADGRQHRIYRAYLEVAPDILDPESFLRGLTIAEVRLALRDLSPQDNFLLDDVEFTDTEIAWAMRRPVQMWNETTPYLRRYTYTPTTFPFKHTWLNAVRAELFKTAANAYMRNSLPYSAGGLTVDDKNKYQQYGLESKQALAEYKEWIITTKKAINFSQCFRSTNLRAYGGWGYNYHV